MIETELRKLLDDLRAFPKENEWLEFKVSFVKEDEIGSRISALSNSACLHEKKSAYLVFGVHNESHDVVGTRFRPKHRKVGNEELENWLARLLEPRIDFKIYEFNSNNKPVAIIEIDPAQDRPVKFKNIAYIRVGSYTKKLSDFPEKERKIWEKKTSYDWSAQICEGATINDLDPEAIRKAKREYKNKSSQKIGEVDEWDDLTFLNKAKLTRQNKITRAAIILLEKEEAEHFISPSVAKITRILRDASNHDKDYEHFGPPFISNVECVLSNIRNLKYRYLPAETLFPTEINQYDLWVIREALHNCIAHQDYELKGKINVVERPDELIFDNVGSFIPGSVEAVITQDSPPEVYRNYFLAGAMFNLNMIDTIGGGIKKMFKTQKERFFPLPDYDLSHPDKVIVKIAGKVLNENYTRLLIKNPDMDLTTVMLLDKVQKGISISKDAHKSLKSQKLVEGRYPRLFVSSSIAAAMGEKAKYIRYRAFDNQQYKNMIIAFIKKYGSASREEIDDLLLKKLSDVLSEKQKRNKISNLLYAMSKKDKIIRNTGSRHVPKWVISN
jgi:ATP-dependent DNA helicase RecG